MRIPHKMGHSGLQYAYCIPLRTYHGNLLLKAESSSGNVRISSSHHIFFNDTAGPGSLFPEADDCEKTLSVVICRHKRDLRAGVHTHLPRGEVTGLRKCTIENV